MLGLALSMGSSILGGMANRRAAKAENERRRQEYKRALEIRKRNWLQQRSVYGAKVNKDNIDLNENDLAANRGYAQARTALNNARSAALRSANSALIKHTRENVGKIAASGRTGQSAARLEGRLDAAYERKVGQLAYKLSKSHESYLSNLEQIKNKQKSARNQLYSQVAFTPIPSLAPRPPQMKSESMGLMQGLVGAAGKYFMQQDMPLFSGNNDMDLDYDINPIPTLPDGMTDWSQAEVF